MTRRRVVVGGLVVASLAVAAGVWAVNRPDAGRPEGGAPIGSYAFRTVTETLEARAAGGLRSEVVGLRGFWSYGVVAHSCAPPRGPVGVLEIRCQVDEWALTELQEPAFVIDRAGQVVLIASGPKIQPYLENPISVLAHDEIAAGENLRPRDPRKVSPIVALGHFDDERQRDCPLERRQSCADRFVLDHIASLDGRAIGPNVYSRVHPDGGPVSANAANLSRMLVARLAAPIELLYAAAVSPEVIDVVDDRMDVSPAGVSWYVRLADWTDGVPRPRSVLLSDDLSRIHWDSGVNRP